MKFKLSIAIIFLIFTSSNLLALTLNKMQVSSKQDEPLNAVIDVTFSKGDKTSNLKPAIASKENYEANGLSRLPIHSDIKIRLEKSGNGAKLFLTSQKIVKDPFLDLLIQIDSEKGRVYKEYTVLLEPPEPKISVKKPVEVESKDDEKKEVKEVKEVKVKKDAKQIIVKSINGKTLYQVARENKPSGVTTEQMVLAIFQNNPKAFSEDNVNTLIKNNKLKIPPLSYFENHTHLEARKILRDHNIEWKNKTKKIKKSSKLKASENLKVVVNKDAEKIKELEKELLEAKHKIDEILKSNIESNNNPSVKLDLPEKEKPEILKIEKISKNEVSGTEEKDDGVFVSSISDIDENKIEETEIDVKEDKGLETIHVLLLALFFVLLFGLFVVISRRRSTERDRKLRSFVKEADNQRASETNISQEQGNLNGKKNFLPITDDEDVNKF